MMKNSQSFPRLLAALKQLGFGDNQAVIEALIAKIDAADMLTFGHSLLSCKGHDVVASFNDSECLDIEKVSFVINPIEDSLTPIFSQSYQYSRDGVLGSLTENVLYDEELGDIYLMERIEEGDLHFQIGRIPNSSIADAEIFASDMRSNGEENVKNRVIYYDHVTANMPKAKPTSPSLLP